jgi:hypothetical protein
MFYSGRRTKKVWEPLSQKTVLFITTAVRTSDPTSFTWSSSVTPGKWRDRHLIIVSPSSFSSYFIYSLFNDATNSSEYIPANDVVTDLKVDSRGIICVTIPEFEWRERMEHQEFISWLLSPPSSLTSLRNRWSGKLLLGLASTVTFRSEFRGTHHILLSHGSGSRATFRLQQLDEYRFIFIAALSLSRLENEFITVDLEAINRAMAESENDNINRTFYYHGQHPETWRHEDNV